MGSNIDAVVIAFKGTRPPRKAIFCRQVFNVEPYRPKPIVCYSCDGIDHMTHVCPRQRQRRRRCGYINDKEIDDCTREPQCKNCGGLLVATSNDCPKRNIPEKKSARLQQGEQTLLLRKASYAAAAKSARLTQSAGYKTRAPAQTSSRAQAKPNEGLQRTGFRPGLGRSRIRQQVKATTSASKSHK